MEEYNTIILGSGIAGMSCALYLKRAGLSTLIVENGVPGGQLNKIDRIENYPGYTSISGIDLANNLMEQINQYEVEFVYDEVKNIDFSRKVICVGKKEYSYQFLVFATGRREKTLGLGKEQEWIGKGISFCATCDGSLYKNQDVVVIGGGNSAVSEALYLSKICHRVFLIYRNEELRAEEILKDRLKKISNVEVLSQAIVSNYLIRDNQLVGVSLKDGRKILAHCVFLAIGHIPNSELFDGEKRDGYIVVNSNGETSKKDVYACGDVIDKSIYQLVTASSEGVVVATSIIQNNQK
ncbi:MAG: NAD(P)/FAD-dependent oxidoreductase [Candidatus Aphodocola sp.]